MEDGYGDGDYDDNILIVTVHGRFSPCPLTVDSVVNEPAMRDSILALLQETLADPNKVERPYLVVEDVNTHEWRFKRGTATSASGCHVTWTPGNFVDANESVVVWGHTHGYNQGDLVLCAAGLAKVNYNRLGGGSAADWANTTAAGIDQLVVDSRRFSRLTAGWGPVQQQSNPKRLYHHGIGQCATSTP